MTWGDLFSRTGRSESLSFVYFPPTIRSLTAELAHTAAKSEYTVPHPTILCVVELTDSITKCRFLPFHLRCQWGKRDGIGQEGQGTGFDRTRMWGWRGEFSEDWE